MNRIIKFRGKASDGEWVYGSLLQGDEESKIMEYDSESVLSSLVYYVDDETVGQSTELCDKSGEIIYEGDIMFTIEGVGVVGYSSGQFGVEIGTPTCGFAPLALLQCGRPFKVLGNIHDNPELLNQH